MIFNLFNTSKKIDAEEIWENQRTALGVQYILCHTIQGLHFSSSRREYWEVIW